MFSPAESGHVECSHVMHGSGTWHYSLLPLDSRHLAAGYFDVGSEGVPALPGPPTEFQQLPTLFNV